MPPFTSCSGKRLDFFSRVEAENYMDQRSKANNQRTLAGKAKTSLRQEAKAGFQRTYRRSYVCFVVA
jgi:hypothetical protein